MRCGGARFVATVVDPRLVAALHAVGLIVNPTNSNLPARASKLTCRPFLRFRRAKALFPTALAREALVNARLAATADLVAIVIEFLSAD